MNAREDEIRKRLEGDEAGISVDMVAFDREVRADLRYLLEKVERLERENAELKGRMGAVDLTGCGVSEMCEALTKARKRVRDYPIGSPERSTALGEAKDIYRQIHEAGHGISVDWEREETATHERDRAAMQAFIDARGSIALPPGEDSVSMVRKMREGW